MSKLTVALPTFTPTAAADAADLADNTHLTIRGGSSTQRVNVAEIYMGGQAAAHSPTILVFGRTSQIATGSLTAPRMAADDPAVAALSAPPLPYVAAATLKPQRSATLGMLLNLSFNAWGGIILWRPAQEADMSLLGNAASLGELSLNAFTGGTPGAMGGHIKIEPL
jgi:hypothetical protein